MHFNAVAAILGVVLHFILPVKLWDINYVENFLFPLSRFIQAQEIVWFISEKMSTKSIENVQEFLIATDHYIGITQMVFTNRSDLRVVGTESKKNVLGIVFSTGPDDNIMYVHDRVLLGRHMCFNLIIMVDTIHDFKIVERFIGDFNKRNFQATLLYYQSINLTNELYGYAIYPQYKIKSRTDFFSYLLEEYDKYINGRLDSMGYKIYTPLRQDLPVVFQYKNVRGQLTWQGTSYNLLKVFTKHINATIEKYEMPKDKLDGDVIDMAASLNLIREGKITLMAHAYALFKIDDVVTKSYPIKVVKWCLMVPIWNSVSTMYYPLEPFDDFVWFTIAIVFGTLTIIKCLWCCWKSSHCLAQRISDCFLNSFCLTINIATSKSINAPSTIDFVIFWTIFFYGFFLTANYTSLLGSIFTVSLFRAQINIMDDLIRSNISVMIIDYELDFLLSGGNILTRDFYRLLQPVDTAIFAKHQLSLNTTYAYFITDDKWHFLERQQVYLKQGIFKFTDICFGSYHLAYPMVQDSPLWRNLEYYIFRMHSSGILDYHESTSFDYAIRARLVKRYTAATEFTSAGMEHLLVIFFILLGMFGVSCAIFFAECLLYKFQIEMGME